MNEVLRVAVAQPVCVAHDVARNAATHAAAVHQARSDLLVFPELSLTGYELDAAPVELHDPELRVLVDACADTATTALVGAPVRTGDGHAIAMLLADPDGVRLAYRKRWLGGAELDRFTAGDDPTVVDVGGWRVGVGLCKDTGVAAHVTAMSHLDVDLYAAGLAHHAHELPEQDARGRHLAQVYDAYVAFASFAGATGGGFDETAGTSTIWDPDARPLARATTRAGAVVSAALTRRTPPGRQRTP